MMLFSSLWYHTQEGGGHTMGGGKERKKRETSTHHVPAHSLAKITKNNTTGSLENSVSSSNECSSISLGSGGTVSV